MCSHEAPHISSSSKLGQEMWLSLHSSLLGDTGHTVHSEFCSEEGQGGWA